MRTLIVIDGENIFNSIVREKIAELENTQAIVVIGKRQRITGSTCENIGVVKVDIECKNSVDFVVVSVVANKMASRRYSNAIILSDDIGFQAAILYLKSIGHNVKRVGYKEFVQDKEKKDQQLERMAISCCGYINNHLENGIYKDTFEEHIKELFGKNRNVVVSFLAKHKLITLKSNKIFFDAKLLSTVAKGEHIL